jgi:hypothetical protein
MNLDTQGTFFTTPDNKEHNKPTTAVPSHPGFLTTAPATLRHAFNVALDELERSRGREPAHTGYAAGCHSAVFWAGWRALTDSACDIVRERNPDAAWARSNPAPAVPDLHVVASGPGSGKTTAAKAFMVALTRVMGEELFPIGCALLVHHIETAHRAFTELSALLPGKVAIWTTEHDADRPYAVRQPRFTADELEDHAVIVVTQEFFIGYERTLPQHTGMVLLDATADVDGVTELCPWRKHIKVPEERYDKLEIVHLPSIATETLAKWLRQHQNRLAYVQHIQRAVLEHVRPGQNALSADSDLIRPGVPT